MSEYHIAEPRGRIMKTYDPYIHSICENCGEVYQSAAGGLPDTKVPRTCDRCGGYVT